MTILIIIIWSVFVFWVAYHMGRNDVIAPHWIALIGEMLEQEPDGRRGEPPINEPEWRPDDNT